MKKRGFTLVELLAVISILALIVVVAMPNIMKMFRESKQKSFYNEVETVKNEIKKEVFNASLSGEQVPPVISSVGDYQLDMSGRNLDYYAELNRDGTLAYLEITDGEFYYQLGSGSSDEGEVVDLLDRDEDVPSKIVFIKDNVAEEKIFVYNNSYDIYDETNSVPIIMTNSSTSNITVKVYYGNAKLGEDVLIPAGAEDYLFFVKFTSSMVNSMELNKEYSLKIDTEINLGKNLDDDKDVIAKHSYISKIKVKRINSIMIIKNIKSSNNNDKIAFNQSGIFVPRGVDIGELEVSVYNDSDSKTYKFVNINRNELKMVVANQINNKVYEKISIEGDELLKYQEYLKGGEYIYSKENYKFNMEFAPQSNVQKIFFDFNEYINPGVYHNGNITIASRENFTDTKFGDFEIQDSSVASQFHGLSSCKPASICFGTTGKLSNDNGRLSLGSEKATLLLDIAQSMSVQDTYSVYMTIDGNINQTGKPAGSFPATILAISEANTKYLSWIGIYEKYLQVYSYYDGIAKSGQYNNYTEDGFASIPISQYEGKIMNIQVTASKNNYTRVYINGELVREFKSGGDTVSYKFATIGDLRPSRGLKFTGNIYDLTLYNTELTKNAVDFNWNYAKKTWNIN